MFDENVNGLIKWERNEARMRETAAALFADPDTLAAAVMLFAEELDAERNRRQGFGKWIHYAGLIKKMLASMLLKLKRIAPTLLTKTGF